MEVEVELVDEHHALHSCGRIGAIELVEHDRATGDVGDQRDEHVVAVGQRGPRRHVPVLEVHHRALSHRVVPSPGDAGRRSDRCLHYSRVKEALRFFLQPPSHIPKKFVLEPLEQRSLIQVRVECGGVGFPAIPREPDLATATMEAPQAINAVPREQRPPRAGHAHLLYGPENLSVSAPVPGASGHELNGCGPRDGLGIAHRGSPCYLTRTGRLGCSLVVGHAPPGIAPRVELQGLRRIPLYHGEAHRESGEQRGLPSTVLGEEDGGVFLERKPQLVEATVVVDAEFAELESAHVALLGGPSGESYGMPVAVAAASAS